MKNKKQILIFLFPIILFLLGSFGFCFSQEIIERKNENPEKVNNILEIKLFENVNEILKEKINAINPETTKTTNKKLIEKNKKFGKENITQKPVYITGGNLKNKTVAFFDTTPAPKGTTAAPANDVLWTGVSNAVTLPVNGTCVTGMTNIDATPDYYGGCVPFGNSSVWFTFTLTGSNDMIDITFVVPGSIGAPSLGNGNTVSLFLFTGPPASPHGVQTVCDVATATFSFNDLTAGTTYYLLVSTAELDEGNFNICATQSIMPTGSQTGPEQDCQGALPLCSSPITFTGSYTGYGDIDEVAGTTCLAYGETNSVWYVFTPQSTGSFYFTIAVGATKDYDFALYNITTIGCEGIPSATPVRCNFSSAKGNTGLTTTLSTELPALSQDAGGTKEMNGISDMAAGNTYALIIDNWTGDNSGFTLSYGGTATITDVTPPAILTAVPSCTDNTILITLSEAVKCITVSQADFTLTNTTTSTDFTGAISSLVGYNCPVTNGALTNQILITHNGSLTTGSYELKLVASPQLEDKCGNIITGGSVEVFPYLGALTLTASDASLCPGDLTNLDANGADGTPSVLIYTLNPGGLTNTTNGQFNNLSPAITTIYTVSATYGVCSKTANTTITVEGNVVTALTPTAKTVCDFATHVFITAVTTINGEPCPTCTYSWTTSDGSIVSGANTAIVEVNAAGTYTVTSATGAGCPSSTSPSSVVSLASSGGGGGTCDVIYVSPVGGGDGLTKSTPTDLATAIENGRCTYSVIKMQKGVYTLAQYQVIHSYTTIEGGYDTDFLIKSSDMSGSTNSTTIRRTTAGDSDDAAKCSAFVVDVGADAFRIQDIRIELPGCTSSPYSHGAGTNKTNYGIRLGSGCTNYNIVRCYIDAGVGSAPAP
ncbi:MAG: hypothetical protein A2275_03910 [Bacteroidetes bacterium RIFOXYA12_FULL_35_11]|nr:MAG: hypothetical protein A2X01_02850 [Bacteroidetes bacterium GWF2_35_48]OFY73437.1 MAG: hypothetical protein A2275_03910 [Bacteroidetes bacterium RIFOXYA12_FULL_35_11]HBX51266.1 hypothetical protein [Bacteroidales bacterium]